MDPRSVTAGVAAPDETAPASNDTRDAATTGERPRAPVGAALPVVPEHQYELGGEHARGGLGRILRGRDHRLDRPVAIKELLRENAVTRVRFLREARITARLQHPGVVPIYEAGVWPSGQPFYAMRLVDGQPLSAAITAAATLSDRLALLPRVLVVAETMAYAHDQGIIHRDLKPSNILVGEYGETVVIDWGIAKQLDDPDDADAPVEAPVDASLTRTGQVLGTPWYMAPEQARGAAVGKPADVYALGAILYHLLCGVPPHSGITDQVVQAVAAGVAPPALTTRVPGLPADLVAIVDKALAVDPAARYPSAADLAADLKRFLAGQLVTVHRYTLGALLRRWLGRHRAAVAVGIAALVALAVGGAISIANIVEARDDARHQQAIAASRADEVSAQRDQLILAQAESALERDPTDALAWLKKYPASGAEWNRVRSIAADAQSRGVARLVLDHGEEVLMVASSADGARLVFASEERVAIWDANRGVRIARFALPRARRVAMSRDGRMVAAAGAIDHDLRVWTATNDGPRRIAGHTAEITRIEITDAGQIISASKDGTLRVWNHDGAALRTLPIAATGRTVHAVLSDGTHIAAIDPDGALRIWDLATTESRTIGRTTGEPRALAASPDGAALAFADTDGVHLVPVAGGPARRMGAPGIEVRGLMFAGKDTLVAVGMESTLLAWRIADGRESPLAGHDQKVVALNASRSGLIATGDTAGEVRVWRYVAELDGYVSSVLPGHRRAITELRISPDDRTLVSTSMDFTARVWRVPPARGEVRAVDRGDLYQLVYAEGGRSIVTTSSGPVRRIDLQTGAIRELGRYGKESYALAVSADGQLVASAGWDGAVGLWDAARDVWTPVRAGGATIWSVDLSPDGRWLAATGDDGAFLGSLGGALVALRGHAGGVSSGQFSPDGSLLATAGEDLSLRLWSVPGGGEVRILRGHAGLPIRPTFTPDGRALVTGGWDGEVRTWDVASGATHVLGRHRAAVRAIAVSPDGTLVASGSRDGVVQVWRLGDGIGARLGGHDSDVRAVAFSPDGRSLASASLDGTLLLWDLASGSSEPLRGAKAFNRVAFRPDGRQLAATSRDGTVHLWSLPLTDPVPTEPRALRAWLDGVTARGE